MRKGREGRPERHVRRRSAWAGRENAVETDSTARTAERAAAERILGSVAQAMKGGQSSCVLGLAREDGSVVPWPGRTPAWSCVDAFTADAAEKGKAAALLESHPGEGYFGAGVLLPSGAVVEAEGRRRRWPCKRAFLKAAKGMGADVVRWFPGRRTRRKSALETASQ